MLRLISSALLLFAVFPLDAEPLLVKGDWPAASPCQDCQTIQFDELEFHLPRSLTGRIYVPDTGSASLVILPRPDSDHSPVHVMHEKKVFVWQFLESRGWLEKYAIGTTADLLRLVGNASENDKDIDVMRKILGIEDALSYTVFRKPPLTAFRIVPRHGESWGYIVTDKDRKWYKLAGAITDDTWSKLLTHLYLSPIR
ncbi:MAG TPA: hypothetical protein ENK51_08615 [Gammaproteobacteria bacterium]|nr:hypothetical protein [Gammaproteobacteria bacterium]